MKTIRKNHPLPKDHEKLAPRLFACLGSVTVVFLIIAVQFLPRGDRQILRIIGIVMLLTAAIFIFAPFYLLPKYGKTQVGKMYMQTGEVVQQSLYAVLCHPQYFGYMLLASGFTLLSQHWITVLLAILSVFFFYVQAVQEERYCLTQFGERYANYLQRVPRFNLIQGIWRNLRGKK
jgi:protein-S-isoprenylcysteine O-methyltransferase Ste14